MTKPPSLDDNDTWLRYIVIKDHLNTQTGRVSVQAFAKGAFSFNETHSYQELSGRNKAKCSDVHKEGYEFAECIQRRRKKPSPVIGYWGYSSETAKAIRSFQHPTVSLDVVSTPRAKDEHFPEDEAHCDLIALDCPKDDEDLLDDVRHFLSRMLKVAPPDPSQQPPTTSSLTAITVTPDRPS